MRTRTSDKCSICGGNYYAKDLCKFHYQRKRSGIIQDMPLLKKHNDYVIEGEVATVYYDDVNRTRSGFFLIDKEDIEKIKPYKWSILNTGYIAAYKKKKTILLHRFLMDFPVGKEVDHINHDRTDNRKSNLRICTRRQNSLNKRVNSKTGEYGIHYSKGYYRVQVDGRYCGVSKDLEEAKRIRNENVKGTEVQKYNYYLD